MDKRRTLNQALQYLIEEELGTTNSEYLSLPVNGVIGTRYRDFLYHIKDKTIVNGNVSLTMGEKDVTIKASLIHGEKEVFEQLGYQVYQYGEFGATVLHGKAIDSLKEKPVITTYWKFNMPLITTGNTVEYCVRTDLKQMVASVEDEFLLKLTKAKELYKNKDLIYKILSQYMDAINNYKL